MKVLKKVLARTAVTVLIIAVVCVAYLGVSGFVMYREAIQNMSVAEMSEKIRSNEAYTPISELPEIYLKAVVSVEDHRFYTHDGIDVVAIARAAYHDIITMSYAQGGSTITQQLAKNMFFSQEKKLERKIAEVFMAFEIEKELTKEEILELYVNSIFFGESYYCVYDASVGFFDVEPWQLSAGQSIILAGLPNAPSVYSQDQELVLQRQAQVLRRMVEDNVISKQRAKEIEQESLPLGVMFDDSFVALEPCNKFRPDGKIVLFPRKI